MLTRLSIPYPSTSLTAPPTDHIKFPLQLSENRKCLQHCWVRNSHNADPALNPISLNFTDTTANWSHQTPIAAAAKKQNKTKLSPVRVDRHFKHRPKKFHFCTCLCETGFVPIWSFHILLGEIVN
jgi:hypothetical protein